MNIIHEFSRNAFMPGCTFGKETLIDAAGAVGIGSLFGGYDRT